jgi:NitT/TauT family transport system permease protein
MNSAKRVLIDPKFHSKLKPWIRAFLVNSIPFLIILLLWEVCAQVGLVKPIILPAFSKVLKALYEITVTGKLLFHLTRTAYRLSVGYFGSALVAILLGLMIGLSKPMRQFFAPLIAATYPLPKVALLSLFIVWLGLGDPPIIAIIFVSASYPILLNTITGILQIDQTLVKAAENLGANHRQILTKVIFPGALPIIFGGLRIGVAVSLIADVAIEMYIANDGLGYLLAWATEFHLMELLFSVLIVIGIFGIILFKALDLCESILVPWKK